MAVAVMQIGMQLGNTGVMLAWIRDVTPLGRVGLAIGLFGAAGPVGFAVGPLLAGMLIDGAGWSISGVYALGAAFSLATALAVAVALREVRPAVVLQGRVLQLAYASVRNVLTDPDIRRLFLVYGVVFLANQVSRPYTPLLVEETTGVGPGLASAIGLVMGAASLVGALTAPVSGWAGDRLGFRQVLVVALATGGVASLLMPAAPGLALLAAASVLLGAAVATTGAMVFSLLATEVSVERRSATLNLVYLPLYIAGVIGPATGSAVAAVGGTRLPFVLGAAVFFAGAAVVAVRRRPRDRTPATRQPVP
jgi:MFS family permease